VEGKNDEHVLRLNLNSVRYGYFHLPGRPTRSRSCTFAKAYSGRDAHAPVVTFSFEAQWTAPSTEVSGLIRPIMGAQDTHGITL
jgi:hypothetical protein